METITDVAARSRNIGLVEALDRVLDKGVVVDGDVYLCVAGIELVYLKLKLLLASTATIEKHSSPRRREAGSLDKGPGFNESSALDCQSPASLPSAPALPPASPPAGTLPQPTSPPASALKARLLGDFERPPLLNNQRSGKVNIDPKKVEQGLAKLVLTLVELLRNLMEKQALRRIELGTLREDEVEALGEAFLMLANKMKELKNVFGLEDKDLNLDLGPLGELI